MATVHQEPRLDIRPRSGTKGQDGDAAAASMSTQLPQRRAILTCPLTKAGMCM